MYIYFASKKKNMGKLQYIVALFFKHVVDDLINNDFVSSKDLWLWTHPDTEQPREDKSVETTDELKE